MRINSVLNRSIDHFRHAETAAGNDKGEKPFTILIAALCSCAVNICYSWRELSRLLAETIVSETLTMPSLAYALKLGLLPAASDATASRV